MATATLPSETYESAMDAIAASFRAVEGAGTFDAASSAYLRGELDINTVLDEMESFFQGAMVDGRVERDRVVELSKHIETMCGSPSVILTVTSCTLAVSCATC